MLHSQTPLKPVLEHIPSHCWSRVSNNLLWLISNTSSLREIKINCHYAPLTTLRVTTYRLHGNTLLEKCMGRGETNHLFKILVNHYILTESSDGLHGETLSKIITQRSLKILSHLSGLRHLRLLNIDSC